MSLEFEDQEDDDDCRVIERPSSRVSIGSSNDQAPNAGYMDGRRMSCKRKALEAHVGVSSGVENNNVVNNNGPDQADNGLCLSVGRAFSSSPFSSTAHGTPESSRRNFRLRINGLHQQEPILPENPLLLPADAGNIDVSSSRHSSRLALCNRLLDLNPSPAVENGVPSMRRNHQSRWNSGPSSVRSSRSFGTTAISYALYEELAQRTLPSRVSEHPMFASASETGNSSQNPINWNFSSGESSSTPSWAHRSFPQYPRRLSEIVRRSLLSERSVNNNNVGRSGSTQETTPLTGPDDNPGRHVPSSSRSALLERHVGGASGIPYSWRTLASASEARSSIMSEQIRHVLDLMRRGEGLRFEDVMVLDHSVLFGMADIHDRHRDMRLDVDNMSYEELLALEERIGNVCTGLTEENILSGLKQRKFVNSKVEEYVETEPCSICREEYNDGEDLGTLECGHDFHKECIKQWLVQKNLCPICKTTGLTI
ncbi:E3 ubiquitin-protein ligase mbr2 [Phtheirospermum japonicum]|uniref:RING-type E3 ubiquitin transferase n=1 Tax=Phtheirospermum japonicum TaxID=374723 RepID=A0A830CLS3_9LAMI|nr:E3 ubiquitin-protein ligase mbr2 [Phtheirospermum japonicum]